MAITSRPNIKSVTITPNPVDAKSSIKVVVDAEDKTIVYTSETIYAGSELKSGQEIGVI